MIGNKKLAIIARMDHSGLGHQTRDLVRLLNPDKVVVIDFTFYNGFKQHPEWYDGYDTTFIEGFIQNSDIYKLCGEVDIILTCETFYNLNLIDICNRQGVATINQINYEFFEPLANRQLLLPTNILMPSYWYLDDLKRMTIPGKVEYLPPPTFVEDFDSIREENYKRKGKRRFLHVAGKMAAHDRAGTRDLLDCLKFSMQDYELVVKVQAGERLETTDDRVILDYSVPEDERELYRGFDAMIQPRRYAGLNLPMNEALSSGLPVIMTDISPNNQILPLSWLVPAFHRTSFVARTSIDVFSAYPQYLAAKLDQFAIVEDAGLRGYKDVAYRIALQNWSPEVIKQKWNEFIERSGIL